MSEPFPAARFGANLGRSSFVYRAIPRKDGRADPLDEHDIREFLATRYARVVNGLALVCGSVPLAEDAVQEALARAWERSERGQHIESPAAWITAVATNLLRDGFRRVLAERRARARLGAGLVEAGEGGVVSAARRLDLTRALAAMPRRQREVAVLRYYLDMDVLEIAAVLGIPEGTAKSALHRARRSLAAVLGESDDEVQEVTDVAR